MHSNSKNKLFNIKKENKNENNLARNRYYTNDNSLNKYSKRDESELSEIADHLLAIKKNKSIENKENNKKQIEDKNKNINEEKLNNSENKNIEKYNTNILVHDLAQKLNFYSKHNIFSGYLLEQNKSLKLKYRKKNLGQKNKSIKK